MSHRHGKKASRRQYPRGGSQREDSRAHNQDQDRKPGPALEIVLRADSDGSLEAAAAGIEHIAVPGVDINVIHRGVGDVTESDILIAETASRLIVGFQTSTLPAVDRRLMAHGVEVRLYSVIYTLTEDLRHIARDMVPTEQEEELLGSARVIALFKSSRRGIIAGCEIQDGHLAVGQTFRIISDVGIVYMGRIESLHIEQNAVNKAVRGQQVGIKIHDFNRVRVGDLVESFRILSSRSKRPWKPEGHVIRL
jgi:translation initiation factor IF-2